MDYSQALQKLRNHSNMPGTELPESESFLFALWQAERQEETPELRPLFDDIISCLGVVNWAINTEHPSDTVEGKAETLPRSLVANVSGIMVNGWRYFCRWSSNDRFSNDFRTELAAMLSQIAIGWGAVLAGDIDNIRDHIREQF